MARLTMSGLAVLFLVGMSGCNASSSMQQQDERMDMPGPVAHGPRVIHVGAGDTSGPMLHDDQVAHFQSASPRETLAFEGLTPAPAEEAVPQPVPDQFKKPPITELLSDHLDTIVHRALASTIQLFIRNS